MFKIVKATRRARRSTSPAKSTTSPDTVRPVESANSGVANTASERLLHSFFDAESIGAFQRPWLRIERGLRLQKLRQFSDEYPGLSAEEHENLFKTLVKANDARLLNTKQQIVYEDAKIQSIRGLKMVRIGDTPATFKIEAARPATTKKAKAASASDSTGAESS